MLVEIAVSPNFTADRTVFAVAGGELIRSSDGGVSWTVLPRLKRYEDSHIYIERGGVWKTRKSPAYSAGRAIRASQPGAWLRFRFFGTGVNWVTAEVPKGDVLEVLIDNQRQDRFTKPRSGRVEMTANGATLTGTSR